MNKAYLAGIAFALIIPANAQANCDALDGRWVNARGSVIELENANLKTGQFAGRFVSEASITDAATFMLTGWVNKTAPTKARPHIVQSLSFTVRWGQTGSITSWTGYCREENHKTEIVTLWHLVRSHSENDFDHIHSGSDIFVKTDP